ncbi:gliding motility-associated ABC transporter permease subunit GldF [Brumimicrobium salinarum]|uniref:Gliding motility-associated ABC transporter permease subunit GldF n=1 Tax=Brumimicrobium salinarum TaxID=2058658 RepID=A0A2I0R336_9FLAO|nr:ABC transporter permease subunit [Brumimicrobium salinarum]PKR80975.1 gliding motility-associated ABC transporter permease subunit GldF [Brumimicrobium salinarum]
MGALYLKEIRSFLSSIIGYIFMLIFVITCWLFLWVINDNFNLLDGGVADLLPFFNLAPLILLILIPAITMRSFADERKTGTIELLYTRPISDFSILMAKYLAGVTLVVIALLPTLTFYVSMHYLGDPVGVMDDGAAITSFLGLLLLGASFVAIGIFSSAITSNQIVAFILALFLCWFFFSGLSMLGSYATFAGFDSIIRYASIDYHYASIKKGVLILSDLVYFISVIVFFLFASHNILTAIRK